MKISCTPISFSRSFREGLSHSEYFRYLAECGAEASDFMAPQHYAWFWHDFEHEKKQIVRELHDCGLKLSGYAAGNNFAQPDREAFDQQLKTMEQVIIDAAEFEAPCLRIFGGYHEDCGGCAGIRMANGLELICRALEKLLPLAEKYQVVLALENHGRIPGLSAESAAIIRHFHSPYLRVLLDFANYQANNMDEYEDPLHAYETLKDYMVHCHVKAWEIAPPGSERRRLAAVAGEGYLVPLRQFFYRLQQNNYTGYCSLEYEAGSRVPEKEGVRRSIVNLLDMKKSAEFLMSL